MNKNTNFNQSGRSMVEMLGVLAIIGVLSVGGIAGYTMAMNKHRANEILNAASVRAMMITTQLTQGRKAAELSLAEFGEEKVQGVSFDKEYTDGAETFALTLTWDTANPSVCNQIKNIVGENVTVDTECATFTYKNEFGGGEIATSCPEGYTKDADGYCSNDLGDKKCLDNSHCPEANTYCNVGGSCSANIYTVTAGTCESVGTKNTDYKGQNGYTFNISTAMTWDAADNWCKAVLGNSHGLADKAKIDLIDGTDCTDGNEMDCAVHKLLGRYDSYWLNALRSGDSSCNAYTVYIFDSEYLSSDARNSHNNYALCE